MRKNLIGIFQIAAVYVGTVVGAGFATGKEIVTFFSQYGIFGVAAIVVSGALFIIFGTKVMVTAIRIKALTYEQFNEYLFGKKFSRLVNLILLVMLLGVSSVMLSGAGALFEEQLLLPKYIGVVATLVLITVVISVGVKGIYIINVFFVPMMIVFTTTLLIISAQTDSFSISVLLVPDEFSILKLVVAPFSYVAFNLIVAQAALIPVAAEINDELIVKWGGYLGGLILMIILLSSHFILVNLDNFINYDIPMAAIVNNLAPKLLIIYLLVIYGEIFTSIVANIFGVERQLFHKYKLAKWVSLAVIFVIVLSLSSFNYSELLTVLYPSFGYVAIIFLVVLAFKKIKQKK